jgi:hypothetical protein
MQWGKSRFSRHRSIVIELPSAGFDRRDFCKFSAFLELPMSFLIGSSLVMVEDLAGCGEIA